MLADSKAQNLCNSNSPNSINSVVYEYTFAARWPIIGSDMNEHYIHRLYILTG